MAQATFEPPSAQHATSQPGIRPRCSSAHPGFLCLFEAAGWFALCLKRTLSDGCPNGTVIRPTAPDAGSSRIRWITRASSGFPNQAKRATYIHPRIWKNPAAVGGKRKMVNSVGSRFPKKMRDHTAISTHPRKRTFPNPVAHRKGTISLKGTQAVAHPRVTRTP